MNERHSATTISVAVGLLAAAGVASMLVGLYPGALLLVIALVLAIAQRSAIARALRAPDPHRRRRRLRAAAVLGVVFVASFVAYLMLIGDTWSTRDTVLAIIGNAAMIGAVGFLAAGLLTPKTPNGTGTPERHEHQRPRQPTGQLTRQVNHQSVAPSNDRNPLSDAGSRQRVSGNRRRTTRRRTSGNAGYPGVRERPGWATSRGPRRVRH